MYSQCHNEISATDIFCAVCGTSVSNITQQGASASQWNTTENHQTRIAEILSQPTTREQLRYIITLYAIVSVGLGLVGAIGIELITGGESGMGSQLPGGLFSLLALVVTLLAGPIVAAVSGLHIAERMHQADRTAHITSFVSNTATHLAMVMLAVILLIVFAGSGSNGGADGGSMFDLGKLLVPLVVLATPSGLVGLGSTYLHLQNQTQVPVGER